MSNATNTSLGEFICPADNRTFPDTDAIQFQNTGIIVRTHEATPRFGHTKNITAVIENESSEQAKDYLVGILSASIAMFIFFLLWVSFILICKCLGYNRVGFLSGSRVRIPPPPEPSEDKDGIIKKEEGSAPAVSPAEPGGDDLKQETGEKNDEAEVQAEDRGGQEEANYEQELENWKKAVKVREKRMKRIRITVLFCGLFIVVTCILMIVYGVDALVGSLRSGRAGLKKTEELAYAGIEIIDDYLETQNHTLESARTIDSSTLCTPVVDTICQILEPGQDNCIPQDDIQNFVQGIEDAVTNELTNVRDDLEEVAELVGSLNDKVGQFEWAFWVSAAAAALLALLTIMIMSGVILAWNNKTRGNCIQKFASCMRGWLVTPFFIFLVTIGWVLSMVFVVGSTTAADFCYNSPDQNVLLILDKLEDNFSSVLFQLLVYYVSGCPADSFPSYFQNNLQVVATMLAQLQVLASELVSNADDISQQCGSGSVAISAAATVLQSQICVISGVVYDIADFLTCRNWNSLYAIVVYDAVCYNATTGFSWIATTQFFIVLFSLIMLTLRVAFFEIESEEEYQKNRRCSCCCCSKCGRSGKEEQGGKDNNMPDPTMDTPNQQPQLPPEEAVVS